MGIAFVRDEQELRSLYGHPGKLAARKVLDRLDGHCRDFIAASPFLVLASQDSCGATDASPRGDDSGFVEVIDDKHLLLPDKPGNNRLDSLINILASPSVGMLFLIPNVGEALRINGVARITCDPSLLTKHAVDGRIPKTGIYIEVREAFLHCARALLRSNLWAPETWPGKDIVAPAGRIWSAHIALATAQSEEDAG